jgi:(2R)-3-sulfolactate dehydrogenase (NADP+)
VARVALADLEALIAAALAAAGTSEANAVCVARALVRAEAEGLSSHGAARAPAYADQVRSGKVDGGAIPDVARPKPGLIRVDAKTGFAFPALATGVEAGAAAARETGCAWVAVSNSHHGGVMGHAVEDIAARGLLGVGFTNSPAAIAPWGGGRPLFGTNPIAFACPRPNADPLVIDLSLSKVARGKIRLAADRGEAIAPGLAVDAGGNPTTDAAAAMAGAMLPLGDAKGAQLAMMVELLSAALAASHFGYEAASIFDAQGDPPRLGQGLLIVDADAASGGAFAARAETLFAAVLDQPGTRLPGVRRAELRRAAEAGGVDVPAALLDDLRARAGDPS